MTKFIRFEQKLEFAQAWFHQTTESGLCDLLYFQGLTIFNRLPSSPVVRMHGDLVFVIDNPRQFDSDEGREIILSLIGSKNILYVPFIPKGDDPLNDRRNQRLNFAVWKERLAALAEAYAKAPTKRSIRFRYLRIQLQVRRYVAGVELPPADDFWEIISKNDIHQMAAQIESEKRELEIKETRAAARALRAYLRKLHKWETTGGKSVDCHRVEAPHAFIAYLRWNEDDKMIETSKGCKIKESDAYISWLDIQRRLRGDIPLSGYIKGVEVDSVTALGVKVGWHHIPMAQINKIAAQLNWKVR
ncbi:MAG: hypothetical protein P4L51_01780 [Puia sp.]|nr:hypothetical protein [Puia sp.]